MVGNFPRYLQLIVCAVISTGATVCGASFIESMIDKLFTNDAYLERIASKIHCRLYNGLSTETAEIRVWNLRETKSLYHGINHTKPFVLYIHGYQEHPSNESIQTIVGAYLKRGQDNIIVLDWSELASGDYVEVLGKVRAIGKIVARAFDELLQLGLELETSHMIGHSMGAQVAGFVGMYSKNSIPRITGLDPAKPGFYHPGADHVNAGSARFVDIIHTDGGFYGALSLTGSVDFFANGGQRPQPGCAFFGGVLTPTDFCSHWRSWDYYAESVINELAFPAVQCDSYLNFLSGNCTSNLRIYFGYKTTLEARGRFYFDTNDKRPFSKT